MSEMEGEGDLNNLMVRCGRCGGAVYMNACEEHGLVTSSDCQSCGFHYDVGPCSDCTALQLLGELGKEPAGE